MAEFNYYKLPVVSTLAGVIAKYAGILIGVKGIVNEDVSGIIWGGLLYVGGEGIHRIVQDGSTARKFNTLEQRSKDSFSNWKDD
jgi:hypothetical protein